MWDVCEVLSLFISITTANHFFSLILVCYFMLQLGIVVHWLSICLFGIQIAFCNVIPLRDSLLGLSLRRLLVFAIKATVSPLYAIQQRLILVLFINCIESQLCNLHSAIFKIIPFGQFWYSVSLKAYGQTLNVSQKHITSHTY